MFRIALEDSKPRKRLRPISPSIIREYEVDITVNPFIQSDIQVQTKRRRIQLRNEVTRLWQATFPGIEHELLPFRRVKRVLRSYIISDEQFNRSRVIPAPVVGISPTITFVLNVTRSLFYTKEMVEI